MRRRSLGRMVWIGSGFSMTAPRFVAYSTGTSVPSAVVPACAKGSTSPLRKLTGVGISRTGDAQPASSAASQQCDETAGKASWSSGQAWVHRGIVAWIDGSVTPTARCATMIS